MVSLASLQRTVLLNVLHDMAIAVYFWTTWNVLFLIGRWLCQWFRDLVSFYFMASPLSWVTSAWSLLEGKRIWSWNFYEVGPKVPLARTQSVTWPHVTNSKGGWKMQSILFKGKRRKIVHSGVGRCIMYWVTKKLESNMEDKKIVFWLHPWCGLIRLIHNFQQQMHNTSSTFTLKAYFLMSSGLISHLN